MKAAAFALIALLAAGGSAQESASTIDRIVDRANHTNPYFSAQGLKALKAQGDAAVPALEKFIARRTVLALAPLVVDWLGEVPDDRARAILWTALDAAAFPWKPQAAKALAKAPRAGEADRFVKLASDPLAAVREPALLALGEIAAKDGSRRAAAVAALLAATRDPVFEPRLAAAESLLKLGEKTPIPVLVDALSVERRFFDIDFGVLARRRAWAALEPLVGGKIPYDPSAGPAKNRDALETVSKTLAAHAPDGKGATRPAVPLAGDLDTAIFGLEVRSCRAGDQWIRLTAEGDLVMGNYDLKRKKLDRESAHELERLLREAARPPAPSEPRLVSGAIFGRGGCDFEKWYLPEESELVRVTVGPEGRPQALEAFSKALGNAIERAFGPAAAEEFRDRVAPFGKSDAGED